MKKVSHRAYFALALAMLLLVGMVVFAFVYAAKADAWVSFPGSPHVYASGNLDRGVVYDRNGNLLLDATNGRTYASDYSTRVSTLHLLGDREGYISAPLLDDYADEMIGYDKINGLYRMTDGNAEAKLTISAAAQNAALSAMGSYHGTVGVYNYKTGEILCALSTPGYDPDNVPDIANDTSGTYSGAYVNRFFNATFTPGSIFKLVTAAAAIDNISDLDSRSFTCEGSTEIGGDEIVCSGVHGTIDFKTGLAHSCNVVFGEISAELGADKLEEYANKAGLTKSFSCDGYTVAAGEVDLSGAAESDVAWAGIGQYNDEVNACAFMRYMGAIANGGSAAEPYLMGSITCGGKTTYQAKTKMMEQFLSAQTAQKLAEYMRNNVETIYGDWQFGGLTVCAKSGTAEREGQTANAMFAGFVQDEAYPLAFVVFVENGGSGSQVAAPIAATVLQACVSAMQAGN